MFFLLEIMATGLLAVVIVIAVVMAAVWYKRQTHVQLTPGELAQDRVLVARADRDIAEIQVETEYSEMIRDRILTARTENRPIAELKDDILALPVKAGDTRSPLPSTSDDVADLSSEEPQGATLQFGVVSEVEKKHLTAPLVHGFDYYNASNHHVWRKVTGGK